MKFRIGIVALALLLTGAMVCPAQRSGGHGKRSTRTPSVHMGTWKLNEAKSKFPQGATKNHTVVYEAAGDMTKVTVDGTAGDGSAIHSEWTGKFDGKPYALTGDPAGDMRSYRVVNSRTLSLRSTKAGKLTTTATIVVSRDGKSRTVTASSKNAQGKWISSRAFYDKQ